MVVRHEAVNDEEVDANTLTISNELVTDDIFKRGLSCSIFILKLAHDFVGNKFSSAGDGITIHVLKRVE